MSSLGTRNRIAVALVAVAVVTAAVAGGIAWWLSSDSDDPPIVSAQDIVENACSRTEGSGSFDIRAIGTTPDQRAEYNIRVSGEDFHMTMIVEENGEVVLNLEFVMVNGIEYGREVGGEWENLGHTDFDYRGFLYPIPVGGEGNAICPELGSVARVGEEMLESASVERFRLAESINLGPIGNVDDLSTADYTNTITLDLWVDSTGQLVQTESILTVPAVGDQPGGSIEVLSVISGVGEPNVITAPDIATTTATTTPATTPER